MNNVDIYVQTLAQKHGVVLQKHDPILILHTFLECFLNDLDAHQAQSQQTLASRLEEGLSTWDTSVTSKASRVLTTAIEASRKEAEGQYQKTTEEFAKKLTAVFEEQQISNRKILYSAYNLAVLNMIGAGLLALAAMFIFLK